MPFPRVTKNLSLDEYISRCVSSPIIKKEFPDLKQRTAVCAEHYKAAKKKNK